MMFSSNYTFILLTSLSLVFCSCAYSAKIPIEQDCRELLEAARGFGAGTRSIKARSDIETYDGEYWVLQFGDLKLPIPVVSYEENQVEFEDGDITLILKSDSFYVRLTITDDVYCSLDPEDIVANKEFDCSSLPSTKIINRVKLDLLSFSVFSKDLNCSNLNSEKSLINLGMFINKVSNEARSYEGEEGVLYRAERGAIGYVTKDYYRSKNSVTGNFTLNGRTYYVQYLYSKNNEEKMINFESLLEAKNENLLGVQMPDFLRKIEAGVQKYFRALE